MLEHIANAANLATIFTAAVAYAAFVVGLFWALRASRRQSEWARFYGEKLDELSGTLDKLMERDQKALKEQVPGLNLELCFIRRYLYLLGKATLYNGVNVYRVGRRGRLFD